MAVSSVLLIVGEQFAVHDRAETREQQLALAKAFHRRQEIPSDPILPQG